MSDWKATLKSYVTDDYEQAVKFTVPDTARTSDITRKAKQLLNLTGHEGKTHHNKDGGWRHKLYDDPRSIIIEPVESSNEEPPIGMGKESRIIMYSISTVWKKGIMHTKRKYYFLSPSEAMASISEIRAWVGNKNSSGIRPWHDPLSIQIGEIETEILTMEFIVGQLKKSNDFGGIVLSFKEII